MSSKLPSTASIGSPTSATRLLYLSPTSNNSANLAKASHFLHLIPSNVRIDFYNAPEPAPRSIDGSLDGVVSAAVVLRDLGLDRQDADGDGEGEGKYELGAYGAIIIGCFSAHLLVPALKETLPHPCPAIISLFEVAVYSALQLGPTFGIVTTGKQWEPLFDEAIRAMGVAASRYTRTVGCGHNAVNLQDNLDAMISAGEQLVERGAAVLILGCGGMCTMRGDFEGAIQNKCGRYVPVVDGVHAAIEQGMAYARMGLFLAES
ncbi:hypothetical protein L202_05726 [Cryptococcus amylolentus CBS 6039]|uniref:Asp/Glu/hydantoin racemase n=1 Tax=Cryptococcus amylolentus CBS 6039 TaxID=1295533 RepID=A0A1E3HM30_9TREE|nr:hypothetical protein L202_05726 [Cryptococcus amylolentus CBS 6039]ODN77205.1 hypothetical protein L202_05726 [Cryptococcus amylolentus CBS 6039]